MLTDTNSNKKTEYNKEPKDIGKGREKCKETAHECKHEHDRFPSNLVCQYPARQSAQ